MTTIINGDSNINLDFTTAGRITGDFSNATVASRATFQTSTANSNTSIGAIPAGTSLSSNFTAFAGTDSSNTSFARMRVDGASATTFFESSSNGTGTNLPIAFNTAGSETLRLSSTSKAVILAGGSTSANGTGITFPATQSASSDANTLDDYEEGTWTPLLNYLWTISGTVTATGTYTKTGRQVFVTWKIVTSGGGSVAMNAAAQMQNCLPFPTQNPAAGGWGVASNYGLAANTQNLLVDGTTVYPATSWPATINSTYSGSVTYCTTA